MRYLIWGDTVSGLKTLAAAGWRHVILSNHVSELSRIV